MLKGYRVLRGPFFVSGAEADGDVGVPGVSGQCDRDGAGRLPCAAILGRAGGWPPKVDGKKNY